MNSTEFWRPQAVIDELERVLRETLNASSRLRSPTSPIRSMAGSAAESSGNAAVSRRGFLTRLVDSMGQEQRGPGGGPEVEGRKLMESVGLVLVKARLEEICLRTVTEFGLYDTMARQCVIIRVDARC